MNIAVASYPVTYHANAAAWQQHMAQWVQKAAQQQADVLVFPEYGAMELVSLLPTAVQQDLHWQISELATLLPLFLETFEKLARRHNCRIVCPSLPVQYNGQVVNRAYVAGPQGVAGYQDKWFMTRFEDEQWGISAGGTSLTVFETPKGHFGVQLCFDVEFPVGAQYLAAAGAQVIVAPSCTETLRGATRVHIGARARALENQCYVAVSQTVGLAEWSPAVDINYGFAAMYGPPDVGFPEEGILGQLPYQQPGWLVEIIRPELLESVRAEGQVLNFATTQRQQILLNSAPITVQRVSV